MILVGGRNYVQEFNQYFETVNYVPLDIFCKEELVLNSDEPIVIFSSPFLAKKNFETDFNILKFSKDSFCENFKSRDVIFLSSASVYGLSERIDSFDESSELNGKSDYASEKLYFESLLREVCSSTVFVRSSGFFGEVAGFSPRNFLNSLKADITTTSSNVYNIDFCGEQIRDFTYVYDLIEFISLMVRNFPAGHVVYNYSSTEPVFIKDLVSWVANRNENIKFNFIKNSSTEMHASLNTKKIRETGMNIKMRDILAFLECEKFFIP